jgi:hypothetical protein
VKLCNKWVQKVTRLSTVDVKNRVSAMGQKPKYNNASRNCDADSPAKFSTIRYAASNCGDLTSVRVGEGRYSG